MPIGLRGDLKDRLLKATVEALPHVRLNHGMFIDRKTGLLLGICDWLLPREGKLHDRLVDYIGEFPFTTFVLDTIGWELWELDQFKSDVEQLGLCEIQQYQDVDFVASRLVDGFISLPWKYTVSFPLPEQLSALLRPTVDEFVLSPTLKLTRATSQFAAQFPLKTENERRQQNIRGGTGLLSLLAAAPPEHPSNRLYLQVRVDGFVGQYGSSGTVFRAERMLRAFCGMGLALRLFKYQHKLPSPVRSFFYVHKENDNQAWTPEYRLETEEATDRGLVGLVLHDLEGFLDDDAMRFSWAEKQLTDMAATFSAYDKGKPIILASQWLLESYASRDELLSFVQAMVVLEILLGDKRASDEIGVGALIRNRCAYLIGSNQNDRTEILRIFGKIYDVRSQIVHAGKQRLTLEDRNLFSRLQWMCRRVIDREIELVKANPKPENENPEAPPRPDGEGGPLAA